MNILNGINKFYDQVKQEIKKVTWPSKQELIYSSLMVISVVTVFSFVVLFIDYIINMVIQFLLRIGK
ncbi:MAG: preprotein translocase subunit SecE [Rickettsiaceae bacterium]|nr:preprotein translocase subunit SecE [Rickettsiaceae bacterium]